jgi:hypothetical protein
VTRAVLVLLLVCAGLRQTVTPAPRTPRGAPRSWRLPGELAGAPGRAAPLSSSERVLARREGVRLTRVDYGTTQVALTTTRGVKELHPPEACLRAARSEIVTRVEEPVGRGCALRYELRTAGAAAGSAWLYVVYLEEGRPGPTCSALARFGRAALGQLSGHARAGASLEVMDRDRQRARERLDALLAALAPRTGEEER